ncbi:neural cell adhesion molecule 2-like [Dendronephthya gigantea]|uniref:neural cell adhesion molecule 2-like n=1 Tax=Dendronephthya gigantea TaxID=151771 RepID=UPI0010693690|nr:neural cell adhesion molecule 2-like [Dendronephthya gigantea]
MGKISLLLLPFIVVLFSALIFCDDQMCFDTNDNSTASPAPVLVYGSSSSEDFFVNEEIFLYCCFQTKQPFQVKWYKNNIPLSAGARYKLAENNQVLTIANGCKFDEGVYRCEGSNKHDRQSWNITVIMHLPVCQSLEVSSPKTAVTVREGENANLTCTVQLSKNCTASQSYFWRNPHGKILTKNTRYLPTDDNNRVQMVLTLKQIKKKMAGTYRCITITQYTSSTARSSGVQLNVIV